MTWLSRLTGGEESNTQIDVSGKTIEIFSSIRANKELMKRALPLVVELELAFACIARKKVRFHETPTGANVINVHEKLTLQITTIVPDVCSTTTPNAPKSAAARIFLPKWVRIDYSGRNWIGEYGL